MVCPSSLKQNRDRNLVLIKPQQLPASMTTFLYFLKQVNSCDPPENVVFRLCANGVDELMAQHVAQLFASGCRVLDFSKRSWRCLLSLVLLSGCFFRGNNSFLERLKNWGPHSIPFCFFLAFLRAFGDYSFYFWGAS